MEETTYRLVIVFGPQVGQGVQLDREVLILGHGPGADVAIGGSGIAERHARLARAGNTYTLEDLGSASGTLINGRRLRDVHTLQHGDRIGLGPAVIIEYQMAAAPRPTIAAAPVAGATAAHVSPPIVPTYPSPPPGMAPAPAARPASAARPGQRRQRYGSLFWPVVLLGLAALWFLGARGIPAIINPWAILRLWPLVLFVGLLEIPIGRRWALAGTLIGLLLVLGIAALLIAGPGLSITNPEGTEYFGYAINTLPGVDTSGRPLDLLTGGRSVRAGQAYQTIEGTYRGEIILGLSRFPATAAAQEDPDQWDPQRLFNATFYTLGEITYESEGSGDVTVTLRDDFSESLPAPSNLDPDRYPWSIGLNPGVPLDLIVDGGSGAATLDLSGLLIATLDVSGGSGAVAVTLPLPLRDSVMAVTLSGAEGAITVALPAGAAVSVRAESAEGLSLPPDFVQAGPGLWTTPGFDAEADHIAVTVEMVGEGGIALR
jgi:hypothetical protein